MKKLLILISLLLVSFFLKGENVSSSLALEMVYLMKNEVYKSVILSEYLPNDIKYHLVNIPDTSLDLKYTPGFKSFFYDIKVTTNDTISVYTLREELPINYYVHMSHDQFVNNIKFEECVNNFVRLDTSYISIKENSYYDKHSCDIIQIFEPFDKWFSLYESAYFSNNDISTTLSVKYKSWDKTKNTTEVKYFLFQLKLTNGEFKITDSVFIENK